MDSSSSLDPIAELTALLHRVGGRPFALPVPVDSAPPVAAIGTLGGLPAWATIGSSRQTLQTARGLARRGQLGLILAADTSSGRWMAAISIMPVRAVSVLRGDLTALPWKRLARAAQSPPVTSLEQAVAYAEALDIDAAGRRTFRLLHKLVGRAVEILPQSVRIDDRHAWALMQLTRLLFLRFVEAEGWLDGNARFLAAAFDRCLIARRDPTRHLLHPLFFGTLNRPRDERSRLARAFGAIPFLNGGLFEPHPIERRTPMRLPVSYWRDAFEALVDRVEVTLDGDANDGRVAPELLGRVFEGVMEPSERKEHGAFFTPPALVDAMVREALTSHLAPRMGRAESAISRALDEPDRVLRRTLLDVTVLDPAVGSGAFLVGALAVLHGPGPREERRVRFLVTRRLFGVDRHPDAVRLCELRLWLEVLRAMRGRKPIALPPLPNLDTTVRAGDTLIDPLQRGRVSERSAREIASRQREIEGAHGRSKRSAIAAIRRSEHDALLQALLRQRESLDEEIAQWLAAARAPTLFGERRALSAKDRQELARLRHALAACRRETRRLTRNASAAPFAVDAAFAPVLSRRGGFDLVVGNPPWVRAERLPAATRDALAARYRWWRGSGAGWRHLPDVAVAFTERSYQLLAPGGTLGLLVPAKIATANYGVAARAALAAQSTLHCVADLADDPRAGFEATTYPLAIIATRRTPGPQHRVRLGLADRAPTAEQAGWAGAATWVTAAPAIQRLAARMAAAHPPFSDYVVAHLGVKTGANAAFVDPPEALRQWSRPAIRGRNIRPFAATPGGMVLWPADDRGVPWDSLPAPVAAHLRTYAAQLGRRADQGRGPSWQLFRTRAATAPHRVVWRDLASTLQAAVLWQQHDVPLNSCYVAALRSEGIAASIAAWLNATPIRIIARLRAEPAAGGCARFAARAIGAVPLPPAVLGDPVLAAFTHAAADHDVQDALDTRVMELLGLTSAERATVDALAANHR